MRERSKTKRQKRNGVIALAAVLAVLAIGFLIRRAGRAAASVTCTDGDPAKPALPERESDWR